MERFTCLPLELQYSILISTLETLRVSRKLNHFYRNLVSTPYYRHFYSKTIGVDEIKTYLQKQPAHVVAFNWSLGYCIVFHHESIEWDSIKSRWEYLDPNRESNGKVLYRPQIISFYHGKYLPGLVIGRVPTPDRVSIEDILSYLRGGLELDLRTQFEIYAARLDLSEIQPNYAHLQIFDLIKIQAREYQHPNSAHHKNSTALKLWIQVKILDYLCGTGRPEVRLMDYDDIIISMDSSEYQNIHKTASRFDEIASAYFLKIPPTVS